MKVNEKKAKENEEKGVYKKIEEEVTKGYTKADEAKELLSNLFSGIRPPQTHPLNQPN